MELKPLLKLLRAQGVLKYKTPELELELSESVPTQDPTHSPEAAFPEDRELTYEERLYYSATPPLSPSEEPNEN